MSVCGCVQYAYTQWADGEPWAGGLSMWPGPQATRVPAIWVLTDRGATWLVPCCFDVSFYTVHMTCQSLSPAVALHSEPPQISTAYFGKQHSSILQSHHFIHLPCDPASPLLGVDPGEMELHVHRERFMSLFIAALFIIVPNWTWPKVYHMEDIHIMGYHPVIGRNKILTHTWWKSNTSCEVKEAHRTACLTYVIFQERQIWVMRELFSRRKLVCILVVLMVTLFHAVTTMHQALHFT